MSNAQYMTIQYSDRTATIKTNSEKAIKMAIKKIYGGLIGEGSVKSIEIKGNVIKFTYTEEKQFWGYWQPTSTGRVTIIENTFATEETAEVVEAPAAEVITEEHTVTMSVEEKRAAWDIFVKEWAKGHAEDIHAIRAAEAKDATMDAEERLAYNEGRNEVKVYAETTSVADIEAHIAAYTSLFTDHLATVFANGMRTELAAITK